MNEGRWSPSVKMASSLRDVVFYGWQRGERVPQVPGDQLERGRSTQPKPQDGSERSGPHVGVVASRGEVDAGIGDAPQLLPYGPCATRRVLKAAEPTEPQFLEYRGRE